MNSASVFHNRAMDFVDRAARERSRGDKELSNSLFRQALDSELKAIDELPKRGGLAWSILHRSAATMALDCGDFRMAEKLASTALAGDTHPEIADELRDVWERANFHRHLRMDGMVLGNMEVQLSLVGSEVAGGMTSMSELVNRIDSFQKLVHRIVQRKRNPEYRNRVPSDVKSGYRVFAASPTAGSFAIAIRIAHAGEQSSFPGMLGTEEVIGEFMDLLEWANDSEIDKIEKRIPDPHYLQNFVGLGKRLAPDGRRIRQVGITSTDRGKTRSLSVTTPASQFLSGRVEPSESSSQLVEASGVLRFADASGKRANRIRLHSNDGAQHDVLVPPGLMDDIVRPMWNLHVTVRGSLGGKQRIIRLHEIWESDSDPGKQGSRIQAISIASHGIQEYML